MVRDQEKGFIIMGMEEYGKDNGNIIYKMVMESLWKVMGRW
jgi:hypothetical protein